MDAESERLERDGERDLDWKRWGPYLAERQWATVREDYSPDGECWGYFTHEHARARAYRWGEDGLLGITDRQGRLCLALALWNERDEALKERLFGLTGPEGNHGEDVKENYFYQDSTPTHAYTRALYKYPHEAFPYARLRAENATRGRDERELDLEDTGVYDAQRYFDVTAEYAKASPNDILVQFTLANRGPDAARIHVLPTLWFRNTWSWGRTGEEHWARPAITAVSPPGSPVGVLTAEHASLGTFRLAVEPGAGAPPPELLFTENETNVARLWGGTNASPYVKDAFHAYVVHGRADAVNPARTGTKAAAHYVLTVPAGASVTVRLRLTRAEEAPAEPFGDGFAQVFAQRAREADEFYAAVIPANLAPEARAVMRQAYAGLLFSKQFYHYVVPHWLAGDPAHPAPPAERLAGRNREWTWVYCRDVIAMPDKWEYPWFAAWDLAFHAVPLATVDPAFAKEQLLLLLREWYMHPNGQLPAYEFNFSDVNPPVHAWAAWRVYRTGALRGKPDRVFLARVFQKLLLNFTWWVNRKDAAGDNIFAGGFLGLDNIGVFDRSKPLPQGWRLSQADGTAWMAFYCASMLKIAIELAREDRAYEDLASKFFEHFVAITDAMNSLGGTGLWHEEDGFYYDQLVLGEGAAIPLRVRSMVGIIPLFAAAVLDQRWITNLPGFAKRLKWFLDNRPDLARNISYMVGREAGEGVDAQPHRLLAIPTRERLAAVLRYVLDEREFLAPHGIRSMSRAHLEHPYVFHAGDERHEVRYVPGESDTGLFGGNSNWRGPIWFPVNFLLIEALLRYHEFYGDGFTVEYPTGSGRQLDLRSIAHDLTRRLTSIFLPDASGRRPFHGDDKRFAVDPHWRDHVLFHEYFDGDTGRGCGASHQTGWTALVVKLLDDLATEGAHPPR